MHVNDLLDSIAHDIRYAIRGLRLNPWFATVVVLSLALGIGANTTVFSLVDTVLLRSLPVREPSQLYFLNNVSKTGGGGGAPPYPCFELFRDQSRSFSGMAAFTGGGTSLIVDGRAEPASITLVSDSFFSVLGVGAALGRSLTAGDNRLSPPVAVISYGFWQRRFGGAHDVIGKTVQSLGRTFAIVGVTPRDFYGLQVGHPFDVALPFTAADEASLRSTETWWFDIVGRLAPGVSPAQARAEIDPIFQHFMTDVRGAPPKTRPMFDHMELTPALKGLDQLRRRFSRPLAILMTIAGLVLLIACANIGNLLLARAAARRHEFALRIAIGASRFRLVRQLLTESLLLFALGAGAGLVVAEWGRRALVGFFAGGRNAIVLDTGLNLRLLAFTVTLSMVTGIVFGLFPALRVARHDAAVDISDGARATGGKSRFGLSRTLIALQVALSLTLLVGANLFARTLGNLQAIDPGFRAEGVTTFSIEPIEAAYPAPRLAAMWSDLLERVRALPGTSSASLSVLTPLNRGDRGVNVTFVGFVPPEGLEKSVHLNYASDGYFETMGMTLLSGRTFTARDDAVAPKVAVINETAARYFFGDRNPLGIDVTFSASAAPYRIVGVVKGTRHNTLREDVPRFLYLPVSQPQERLGRLTLAVRAAGDPEATITGVPQQVRGIGSDIVVTNISTMQSAIDRSLLQERLLSALLGLFSALGVLLASIGIYGVVSYGVVQRTREIGVRMALGAQAPAVVWLALRDVVVMLGVGIAVGLPVCLIAGRTVASLLYGVGASDPLIIATAVEALFLVAGVAGVLPARRAAQIDPIIALRSE